MAGAFGQNGWQWLNPQPSGFSCLKVKFTDPQTGFILNNNGDLIRTLDQGGHWRRTDNFPRSLCMDIADSTGVIAGYGGVLYMSRDNGRSWVLVNTGSTDPFQMISIVSRDTLFLASNNGTIYETTDRGATWSVLSCKTQINCLNFINSKTGFAGGPGSLILKTVDGGLTWQPKEQTNASTGILAIQFLNTDTGYAFREFQDLQVTVDGGNTWATYDGKYQMTTIDMVNSSVGYIGGEDGAICRTNDGGKTWNPVIPANGFKDGYQIYSLYFLAADTGFAVGLEGRILKTTDGGVTWNSYSPTYLPITAVSFPTPATGYASDWNYTYKTTDSGRSWIPLSLTTGTAFGSSSRFEQAHFINPDTGFFVSSNYVQLHTTRDGGQTWTTSNPAIYSWSDVPSLPFVDPRNGFLPATNYNTSLILKTSDGGLSWSQAWAGNSNIEYFGRVFYLDTATAYGIQSGKLYKTSDGAQTWQLIYSPAQYSVLRDVCFVNKQTGFIGNDQDQLFVTHDGGGSWQNIPLPYSSGGINAIRFFNEQIGYLTDGNNTGPTGYGNIYRTVDGGQTWQPDMNFGGTGIAFTPDSNVVIAGFAGVLLKSPIRGYRADSLSVKMGNDCNETLSASVSATLGEVDSIGFEITAPDNSYQRVAASPVSVKDGRATCTAASAPLVPGMSYSVRLRFLFDGVFAYSDPVRFVAAGLPKPSISDSAGVLRSSSDSGNQWYLNGVAIAGAVKSQWTPTVSGVYSVQVSLANCKSMSDSIRYFADHLGVRPYPNPSRDYLTIVNTQNRELNYRILTLEGRQLSAGTIFGYSSTFDIQTFAPGEYVIQVVDKNSKQKAAVLFLKL